MKYYQEERWRRELQVADLEKISTYTGRVDVTLGVLRDFVGYYADYVRACHELEVPYRVVDITGPDWIEAVRENPCEAYLVWPSSIHTAWKTLFDERLRIMVEELGKTVYPSYPALWLHESKRRVWYWLEVHGFPHPKTWVFYDADQALEFCRGVQLPVVFKSDLGAMASGVRIFRNRRGLLRHVSRVFKRGFVRRGAPLDRQWSHVLLQDYVAQATEWRMVRIGDSFFGYEKVQVGDFHSGTCQYRYERPPDRLLDLLKSITDRGGFSSMAVDILVAADGEPFVTELHTVFGIIRPFACKVGGEPGRMVRDAAEGAWRFEAGDFCRNHMCNLRVRDLLGQIGHSLPGA
jgi:glutathione synthase/RimK-type ligase-like ATP-grasp enzyme